MRTIAKLTMAAIVGATLLVHAPLAQAVYTDDLGGLAERQADYANACDIVEHNLIVRETIGEYEDLLESQGLAEPAAEYRTWHEEFMASLAEFNLPARGYEAQLRAEVAQRKEPVKDPVLPTHARNHRERLSTAMAEAQQAAHGLASPSSPRLMPAETRGVQ